MPTDCEHEEATLNHSTLSLQGNALFDNLGEPIKRLLTQVNQNVSNEDLTLYSKISVRQLAKVFDMLTLEEDPDKILLWLHREAARNAATSSSHQQHSAGIRQGVARDPIKYYKDLEKRNLELMEKFKQAQAIRDEERALNVDERKRRRDERDNQIRQDVADRAISGATTATTEEEEDEPPAPLQSVDTLRRLELADISGAFERFSARQSTFDNSSNCHQDSEWWKGDEYRRDWERSGVKGKLWNRVVEGGAQEAPPSERNVREEWYRDQVWWKADRYRRDWLASRSAEWWKEEHYVKDWQDFGEKGTMWTACDELSGLLKKGHRRPASTAEQLKRGEWFRRNGPKGIVKLWCAYSEGSFERCTLDEKLERDDYYKNGDWWKSDVSVRRFREDPAQCNALRCAGAAADDGEWWKGDMYRNEYYATSEATTRSGGVVKARLWRAATEKAAVAGSGHPSASISELSRRAEWYTEFWWKCTECLQDFRDHGATGKLWRLLTKPQSFDTPTAAGSVAPYCTSITALRQREEWFVSADDREWWKGQDFIRDWQDHGLEGRRWCAAWRNAGIEGTGDVHKAAPAELQRRADFYGGHWWMQEKFVNEFASDTSAGASWRRSATPTQVESLLIDGEWWKANEFLVEYQSSCAASSEPFWQSPQCIADYWSEGAAGKRWTASTAAAMSVGMGDEQQATTEDLESREAFYLANWWRQDKYATDYAIHGRRGTLWKVAAVDSARGVIASAEQLRERQHFFESRERELSRHRYCAMVAADADETRLPWQQQQNTNKELTCCTPIERLHRAMWLRDNWWKCADVREEYLAAAATSSSNTTAARRDLKVYAATAESLHSGDYLSDTIAAFRASDFEVAARISYFLTVSEQEWWKRPHMTADFVRNGEEGVAWKAQSLNDAIQSLGAEAPASRETLQQRREWYRVYSWRTPESIAEYHKAGAREEEGSTPFWATSNSSVVMPPNELGARLEWLEAHRPADAIEHERRREWMLRQPSDAQKQLRRNWLLRRAAEVKRIHKDELSEVLTQLNDGQTPSSEQLSAIEEAILARRRDNHGDGDDGATLQLDDGVSQEEFTVAVADTNFYLTATEAERARMEAEALEGLYRDDMARHEEEAGYLALEAQEELEAAGLEYAEGVELNEEEEAFLRTMEAEERAALAEATLAAGNSEEDGTVAPDEEAYQAFVDQQQAQAHLENEEEEDDATTSEAEQGYEDDHEDGMVEATATEQVDEPACDDHDDSEEHDDDAHSFQENADDREEDGITTIPEIPPYLPGPQEHRQQDDAEEAPDTELNPDASTFPEWLLRVHGESPQQWTIPVPTVTNNQFLKAYFAANKCNPKQTLFGGDHKRVWVVDHFTRCFYYVDPSGKIKNEFAAATLLQLERNLLDSTRLRLVFTGLAQEHELQFPNSEVRERFCETASAMRPRISVFAPDLTNPDPAVQSCTTTLDAVGAHSVDSSFVNKNGGIVERELSGECLINASKELAEPLTIWTGTFNLQGQHPPKKPEELFREWMPRHRYDVYAIAVQEATFRRDDKDWVAYVQEYLGTGYAKPICASVGDTMLVVYPRRKHFLKMTNIQTSAKTTMHHALCGARGGAGVAFHYLGTSFCFVACQLAGRVERHALRNAMIEEIIGGLELGIPEADIGSQFDNLFVMGDLSYRVELPPQEAMDLIASKDYSGLLAHDQLHCQSTTQQGVLHSFIEPPVTFPPTFRLVVGRQDEYRLAEGAVAPSYCGRVLSKSNVGGGAMATMCTGYNAAPSVVLTEHRPVSATFTAQCIRPVLSCFMKVQSPIPEIVFEAVQVRHSTGPVMKKPHLMFATSFTRVFRPVKSKSTNTSTPSWDAADLPHLVCLSQVTAYLEARCILLIVREGSDEKRCLGADPGDLRKREAYKSCHRGTAVVRLAGRLQPHLQGVAQEFDSDLLCNGKVVARVVGRFTWRPSSRDQNSPDQK